MKASVRSLFLVIFFMFVHSNAMNESIFKPFGMELCSVDDMPKYCAELVKLVAKTPVYRQTGIRWLPTVSPYDGLICTFLNTWALQGGKRDLEIDYPRDARDSYHTNFLALKEKFNPSLLNDLEDKYRQKIGEMQCGWRQLGFGYQACSSKKVGDYVLKKESTVANESKLIMVLARAFGFMEQDFSCTHLRHKVIQLSVQARIWDRFNKVFQLKIAESKKRVLFRGDDAMDVRS